MFDEESDLRELEDRPECHNSEQLSTIDDWLPAESARELGYIPRPPPIREAVIGTFINDIYRDQWTEVAHCRVRFSTGDEFAFSKGDDLELVSHRFCRVMHLFKHSHQREWIRIQGLLFLPLPRMGSYFNEGVNELYLASDGFVDNNDVGVERFVEFNFKDIVRKRIVVMTNHKASELNVHEEHGNVKIDVDVRDGESENNTDKISMNGELYCRFKHYRLFQRDDTRQPVTQTIGNLLEQETVCFRTGHDRFVDDLSVRVQWRDVEKTPGSERL